MTSPTYPDTRLYIDGAWTDGAAGATLDVLNPVDGRVIGRVAKAEESDLERALEAARRGFEVWRRTPALTRSGMLRKAGELMRARAAEIAPILTQEQGKPLAEATAEVLGSAEILEWFAEEARRTYGRLIPPRTDGVIQSVIKEPVGVVAAFTPWNFPISQMVRKVGAALAAGCSMIVKAAEETPASPACLMQALADAGVPAGVLNLVYGVPAEISERLIPDPIVRKVSFTGSVPVGKHLAALAGRHMKRVTMELGGHSPAIVFADADISSVAPLLARSKLRNAGQVCVSPTRFLVQKPVFDEFADRFAKAVAAVKIGDGLEAGTEMGPLVNARRVQAVEELINDATRQGAEVLTGGERIGNTGNFYRPTVLSGVTTEMRIMNEEPFGPVALLAPFEDFDEALAEANRLPFGLASYAFSRSGKAINRLAEGIEAGMLTANHLGLALAETPFGGVKDSGYGAEGGIEAMDAYLNTKFFTHAYDV